MTKKGIVQKTFDRRIWNYKSSSHFTFTGEEIELLLIKMKRELITEINKLDIYFGCAILKDELIGDNE